ncbi:MAG: hypothetical protein IKM98_01285 [Bacteroidales bacterium]|nr:hypothetical protein [Bacteroidales bacterium]
MKVNEPYIKVGRLKATIARKAHLKCADIYVSENQIRHITIRHKVELEQVGLSAEVYVKTIVENFTQIRQGSGESVLLVVYDDANEQHNTAAISLNYSLQKGFWEIKTAQPRRTEEILKKKKIW